MKLKTIYQIIRNGYLPYIIMEALRIPTIRECESCGWYFVTTQHTDDFYCGRCI